jgi:GTPase Era involved in 16S rRNA processing
LNTETLNQPYLLAAHMACIDGQLHQAELHVLRALAIEFDVNEASQAAADKVLTQADDHLSLKAVTGKVARRLRHQALLLAANTALADDFLDQRETQLLEQLKTDWAVDDATFSQLIEDARERAQELKSLEKHDVAQPLSAGARTLAQWEAMLGKKVVDGLVSTFATDTMKANIQGFRIEQLLAGPQYEQAIESCRAVAEQDIAVVELCLEKTGKALEGIKKSLNKSISDIEEQIGKKSAQVAREALAELKEDRDRIAEAVDVDLQAVRELLRKKRKAMGHYCIAFMGRSKAGKSTLHAVVTGGGWDQIGVGKQNTTRLNRVYEWHNIRIIDTPGIATPGGEGLESIANSIVDEADLVCFVVTDNNQQGSEFSFLKGLREKGKPLLVLINVHQNLSNTTYLRRFLDKPDRAFSLDKDKLGGHIDRIRRDAEEHYGTSIFPIVPVQLLAAQMAQQGDHPDSDALLKASRLQAFLDQVRLSLLEQGKLRRSQNLLGSTVADITRIRDQLHVRAEHYKNLSEHLAQAYSQRCQGRIAKAQKVHSTEMRTSIEQAFHKLRQDVMPFATNQWNNKKDLNAAWKHHTTNVGLEDAMHKAQERSHVAYAEDLKDLMVEVGQELALIEKVDARLNSHNLGKSDSSRSYRTPMKVGGGLLTLAGSVLLLVKGALASWAWPVTIVGIVIGALSSVLSSKEEKKKKAVSAIVSSLSSHLDEQSKQVIQDATNSFDKQSQAMAKLLREYFESTARRVNAVAKALSGSADRLTAQVDAMNRQFAARVLATIVPEASALAVDDILPLIDRVEREVGQRMTIYVKRSVKLLDGWEKISEVIQEQVRLQTVKE